MAVGEELELGEAVGEEPGEAEAPGVEPAPDELGLGLGLPDTMLGVVESTCRVIVAMRSPPFVLAEILPVPTLAQAGIVNGLENAPCSEAPKLVTTPPL